MASPRWSTRSRSRARSRTGPSWLPSMRRSGEEARMKPGEILCAASDIVANRGRRTCEIVVANTGDRPVQVGAHYHFFEVNKALRFDREKAFGMRLNIASGTSMRFEPGDERKVTLVEMTGRRIVHGLNNLTDGDLTSPEVRKKAMEQARARQFKGATE